MRSLVNSFRPLSNDLVSSSNEEIKHSTDGLNFFSLSSRPLDSPKASLLEIALLIMRRCVCVLVVEIANIPWQRLTTVGNPAVPDSAELLYIVQYGLDMRERNV